jgi:rhodanese-related sulfurtransferase
MGVLQVEYTFKKIIEMKKLILFILVWFVTAMKAQKSQDVDAATFKKMIEAKKGVLIDLRTPDEIKTKGKIKGAVEIDFLAVNAEEVIKKLDKKKTYLVYCAGGGRSGDCRDLMVKEGFKEVVNLAKGFEDWKRNGFDIEKK